VTAPILVDSHFVLNFPTLTGNVFKSVNVNLKCIFRIHEINYLSRKLKCKQTFAIVCSFTVSVNKPRATDSSISPDPFPPMNKVDSILHNLSFVGSGTLD